MFCLCLEVHSHILLNPCIVCLLTYIHRRVTLNTRSCIKQVHIGSWLGHTPMHDNPNVHVMCLLTHVVYFWKPIHMCVSYTIQLCISSLRMSMTWLRLSKILEWHSNVYKAIHSHMIWKSHLRVFTLFQSNIKSFKHMFKLI